MHVASWSVRVLALGAVLTQLGCTALLSYPPLPETCGNGLDDDGDHRIDCLDSDCFSPRCAENDEARCADGLDNDLDGRADLGQVSCWPFGHLDVRRCATIAGGALAPTSAPGQWTPTALYGTVAEAVPDPTHRFATVLASRGDFTTEYAQMHSSLAATGRFEGTVARFSLWVAETAAPPDDYRATLQIARADLPEYAPDFAIELLFTGRIIQLQSRDSRTARAVARPSGSRWYDVTIEATPSAEGTTITASLRAEDGRDLTEPLVIVQSTWPAAPALWLAFGGHGDGNVLLGPATLERPAYVPCDGRPDPSFSSRRASTVATSIVRRGDMLCGLGLDFDGRNFVEAAFTSPDAGDTWGAVVVLGTVTELPTHRLALAPDGRFVALRLFSQNGLFDGSELTFLASDDCQTWTTLGPAANEIVVPSGWQIVAIAENHATEAPHRIAFVVQSDSGDRALLYARADTFTPGAFVTDATVTLLDGVATRGVVGPTFRGDLVQDLGGQRLLLHGDDALTFYYERDDDLWSALAFDPIAPSHALGAFDASRVLFASVVENDASATAWHGTLWYSGLDSEGQETFGWADLSVLRPPR